MNKCLWCVILNLLLVESCNFSQINKDEDITCINWDSLKDADYLQHPYTQIHFVKLETNENCILNEVEKIETDDSLIFIEDNMQRLYVFNIEGTYVRKIGNKGGSENEYITLFDFVLNRADKKLYIVDGSRARVLTFNYCGDYLGYKDICEESLSDAVKLVYADERNLVTLNFNSPDERFNFSVVDLKHKRVTNQIEYLSVGKNRYHSDKGRSTYHSPEILVCAELSDTIYSLEKEKITPKYVFQGITRHATKDDIDDGVYEFGIQACNDLLGKGISPGIDNLYGTDNILYFQYKTRDGYYRIFYNTCTKAGCKFDMTKELDAANNLLWNYLITASNDAFLCVLPIGDFLDAEGVRKSYVKLDSLLKKSNEEDNPIIAYFTENVQ